MSKGSRPRPYSVSQEKFGNNYDAIFGKRNMSPSIEEMKKGTCGCGRSPTGNCCGWHGLSEDAYKQRLEEYETGRADLSGKEIK
jgi:hypothetical protein